MSIKDSIDKLIVTFNNSPQSMGSISLSKDNIVINYEELKLAGDLLYFYEHVELSDTPIFGGDFYLQIIDLSLIESINNDWRSGGGWNEDYVIFAERNGDVLYCDTSIEGCPVFGSIQKNNFIVSSSLSSFFDVYCDMVKIEEGDFNCDTVDDDFNLKDEYVEKIRNKLSQSLSNDCSLGFERFFLL